MSNKHNQVVKEQKKRCTFEHSNAICGEELGSTRHDCFDTKKRPGGPNKLCAFNLGHPNMACHQFTTVDSHAKAA